MRRAIVLFCAGIASAVTIIDVDRSLSISLGLATLTSLALLISRVFSQRFAARLFAYGTLFLIGFVWHLLWAQARLEERLPVALEGETLRVRGVVLGLPERNAIAQQFQFRIVDEASGFHPRKVTLNYYGDSEIEPGQVWEFRVRLNRPHGFSNPGGFDYESWLMQRGISARGYVRSSIDNRQLGVEEAAAYLDAVVLLSILRYRLKVRVERLVGASPLAGLLTALVLGDRSGITQDSWALFTDTGTNHLFVISGLHIGLISGFSYLLTLQLSKLGRISRRIPAQKCAAAAALASAFCYALLAGFSLPTQRAFIMIAVFICGTFWGARYLVSFRFLLALLIVLSLNPLAITSSGFWLSFVAVAALLAFAHETDTSPGESELAIPRRHRLALLFRAYLKPQFVVLLSLSIPLLVFTGQVSLLSPIINVIAIPVVGLLIVPLCFFALFMSFLHEASAVALFAVAHACLRVLLSVMEAFAAWGGDFLRLEYPQLAGIQLLTLGLASLLLLLPRGVCSRALLLPLLLSLLPAARDARESDDFLEVHIVDVGQGLALIVRTRSHALLYDSGANLSPDFNVGSAVVVPVLRSLGIGRLDAVVISHGDNDHAGGLRGIQQHVKIQRLISGADESVLGTAATPCAGLDGWEWDGVEFRFLHAEMNFAAENDNSCVLQIRFEDAAVLLPGDIEREAERALVLRYGSALASTVLLAPHHGSNSSSSYGLLKNVKPDYVVFSAGYRNSFGHPHPRVQGRYDEFGSAQLTTWETGMISFRFDAGSSASGQGDQPRRYRSENRRYWR